MSIAERAGVSIASVSRVLNGQAVRRDTEERVRSAASELGYVPNAVARSLKGGHTRQLTFAMPDIGNPVYVAMVREIQAVAKAAGYRLLLHSTDAVIDDELAVVRSLADRTSEGLILCPIRITERHIEALTTAASPVVVIGSLPAGVAVDCVQADSVNGAALAVRHLAEGGRRRIAFINGPLDTVPGRNRAEGYRAALAEQGIAYDAGLVAETAFSVDEGARGASQLLAARPDIDAFFCANDQLALGAAQTLHASGARIPEETAVVGMDNSTLARAAWPPLTSVDLGSAERGRTAAAMLIDRLDADADTAPARRATEAPRLVVRDSTRSVDSVGSVGSTGSAAGGAHGGAGGVGGVSGTDSRSERGAGAA